MIGPWLYSGVIQACPSETKPSQNSGNGATTSSANHKSPTGLSDRSSRPN